MKTETAVAILLVAIFALSSIGTITIRPAMADGSSKTLMLSNAELLSASFTREWGPGSLTAKTTYGLGVEFDFTGLTSADTGVGDNWPIDPLAGGAGPEYCDFTGYTRYSMLFNNIGTDPVQVCLFMNTGFDGNPNTYWRSDIITIGAGLSAVVTLDFSSSAWASIGGSGVPVQYINQVSNIGFQVYSGSDGKIIVSGLSAPLLYTDPTHIQKAPPGDIGTTFTVKVTLENFANFAGFDIQLVWDNSLITETSVDYTTSLNALWSAGWAIAFENPGAGFYELAAAALATSASNTGASVLFTLTFKVLAKSSNVPLSTSIHFALVKLSDNTSPIPNPILATATDGMYYMSPDTTPDLELTVLKWDKGTSTWVTASSPYKFEYGNTFEVQVYVSDISANSPLQDYDVKISFDPTLASCGEVDAWGIFGTGTFDNSSGVAHVSGSGSWSGTKGLLFTLTFTVEFLATPAHIWKYESQNYMTFPIGIADATLSFGTLGSIGLSGIATPSPLTIEVDFIRGDVDCNGVVGMNDISTVAFYYGKTAPAQYDLTNDGVIDIYDIVTVATNFGYSSYTNYGTPP